LQIVEIKALRPSSALTRSYGLQRLVYNSDEAENALKSPGLSLGLNSLPLCVVLEDSDLQIRLTINLEMLIFLKIAL
jgi:hypothetical protein